MTPSGRAKKPRNGNVRNSCQKWWKIRVQQITISQLHTGVRLVPISVTLNDLERG